MRGEASARRACCLGVDKKGEAKRRRGQKKYCFACLCLELGTEYRGIRGCIARWCCASRLLLCHPTALCCPREKGSSQAKQAACGVVPAVRESERKRVVLMRIEFAADGVWSRKGGSEVRGAGCEGANTSFLFHPPVQTNPSSELSRQDSIGKEQATGWNTMDHEAGRWMTWSRPSPG